MFTNNLFNTFSKSKKDFVNKSSKTNSIENHLKLSKDAKPFKPEYIFLDNFSNNINPNINEEKQFINLKNNSNESLNELNKNNNKKLAIESAKSNSIDNNLKIGFEQTEKLYINQNPNSILINKNLQMPSNQLTTISANPHTKYVSPKNQTIRKQTSSSNLPTANNSFYTISSLDQNENALNDEYHDISYKNNKNVIRSNRKISYSYKLNQNKIDEDIEISDDNFSVYSNNNSIFDLNYANNAYNNYSYNKASEFKTKYKTEICKFWQVNANCRFGDKCAFAHGKEEIKEKDIPNAYRTRKCKQFYEQGFCNYGSRCQFAHQLNKDKQRKLTYTEALVDRKKSLNEEKSDFINNNRPRLEVFRKLTCPKTLSNCNENQYLKSNSDEIAINKKQYPLSTISYAANDNNQENNLKCDSFNNLNTFENKGIAFEEFSIDDNFKRLKSDLIPKDNYFDIEMEIENQADEEFFKPKNQNVKANKQERKHSY